MLKDFHAYQLSLEFHRICRDISMPSYLRDQLLRSSSSVALNLAEGSAKLTPKEQRRFYTIAYASFRESQAALTMSEVKLPGSSTTTMDRLGACLFRLARPGG